MNLRFFRTPRFFKGMIILLAVISVALMVVAARYPEGKTRLVLLTAACISYILMLVVSTAL